MARSPKLTDINVRETLETRLLRNPESVSDALAELLFDDDAEFSRADLRALPILRSLVPETRRTVAPRRGARAACPPPVDPMTSRGAAKYPGEAESDTPVKVLGGYDGGTEVGWYGSWDAAAFKELETKIEAAKGSSQTMDAAHKTVGCSREFTDDMTVELGGKTFAVQPFGAGKNVHYKWVLVGHGLTLLIHNRPAGKIQPIRLKYGYEAVQGNDFFEVHYDILKWLKSIGFHVREEKFSRLDLQIMVQRPLSDFAAYLTPERLICRGKNNSIHRKGWRLTSFIIGSAIRGKMYDKMQELKDKEEEMKAEHLIANCFAGEMPAEVTRVEFSLRREILVEFEINSITDLLRKEKDLARYLTTEWLRLLEHDKVRGHENTAEVAEVWREVQASFERWFPGCERNEICKRRASNVIRCTAGPLFKQSAGCLASALAVSMKLGDNDKCDGRTMTPERGRIIDFLFQFVRDFSYAITTKARDRAKKVMTESGFVISELIEPCHALSQARYS